jgi:hypothetical protein
MTPHQAHSPLALTAYPRHESVALPPQSLQVSTGELWARREKAAITAVTVQVW